MQQYGVKLVFQHCPIPKSQNRHRYSTITIRWNYQHAILNESNQLVVKIRNKCFFIFILFCSYYSLNSFILYTRNIDSILNSIFLIEQCKTMRTWYRYGLGHGCFVFMSLFARRNIRIHDFYIAFTICFKHFSDSFLLEFLFFL